MYFRELQDHLRSQFAIVSVGYRLVFVLFGLLVFVIKFTLQP